MSVIIQKKKVIVAANIGISAPTAMGTISCQAFQLEREV